MDWNTLIYWTMVVGGVGAVVVIVAAVAIMAFAQMRS